MGGNKHHGLRLVAVLAFSAGIFFFFGNLLWSSMSCSLMSLESEEEYESKKKMAFFSLSLSLTN